MHLPIGKATYKMDPRSYLINNQITSKFCYWNSLFSTVSKLHCTITIIIFNVNYSPHKKIELEGRSYRSYTYEKAKGYFNRQRCEVVYQYNDPNIIWSIVKKYILNCASILCPIRRLQSRQDKPSWITNESIELINERDEMFCEAYATSDPNLLKRAKQLRTDTKREIGMLELNISRAPFRTTRTILRSSGGNLTNLLNQIETVTIFN